MNVFQQKYSLEFSVSKMTNFQPDAAYRWPKWSKEYHVRVPTYIIIGPSKQFSVRGYNSTFIYVIVEMWK